MKYILALAFIALIGSLCAYNSTGGTVTYDGLYTVVTYTSSGWFNVTGMIDAMVLIVAGGGGGSRTVGAGAGGGGAGGLIYNSSYSASGNITVTIGPGGIGSTTSNTPGTNGTNTSFGTLIAIGGGAGGEWNAVPNGLDGGSGGGASYSGTVGIGTVGQGNNGGLGNTTKQGGGGGGGAGAVGGLASISTNNGGVGGVGLNYSINGTNAYYAGGGGGGAGLAGGIGGAGGNGGGGSGGNGSATIPLAAINGAANTGGGGGGGAQGAVATGDGGNGGSGIVIVRYLTDTVPPANATNSTNYSNYGTPPYNIFSCEPIINYQSTWYFNTGYLAGQHIGSCTGTTERFNNIKIEVTGAATGMNINLSGNSTHIVINTSTGDADAYNIHFFNLSTINNSYINLGTSTISNIDYNTSLSDHIGCTNATTGTLRIYAMNSTHYAITNEIGICYGMIANPITFRLNDLDTGAVSMTIMNVSDLYEFRIDGAFANTNVSFNHNNLRFTCETPGICNMTANKTIVSKSWGTGLSKNDTKPTTQIYNATLIGSSQVLVPILSFYPVSSQSYTSLYNLTTLLISIKNNSNLYIYDNTTSVWYFCPAYAAPLFGIQYTVTCIPTGAFSQSANILPLFWITKNCYQQNNTYFWNIAGTSTQSYLLQASYANGTVVNSGFTGTTYTGSQSLVNITNLTITVGTSTLCAYTNQSYIFFAPLAPIIGNNITKIVGTLGVVVMTGFMTVTPFAGAGAIILNDVFGFLAPADMILIFGFAVIVSMIKAYNGKRSFKTLGIFVALGIAMLSSMIVQGQSRGITGLPSLTEFTELQTSWRALAESPNIGSFIITTATFMINFGNLLIHIPGYLSTLLLSSIGLINPILATVVDSLFTTAIQIGITLWIVIKIYEILTRQFPGVV